MRAEDVVRLRIPFVRPPPASVTNDGKRRGKRPVDSRRGNLGGSGPADTFDQIGIVRGSETDVVRKQGRAEYIVVAMYRVGSPYHGNRRRASLGVHGRVIVAIYQPDPIGDRCMFVVTGKRASAIQNGSQPVCFNSLRSHRSN